MWAATQWTNGQFDYQSRLVRDCQLSPLHPMAAVRVVVRLRGLRAGGTQLGRCYGGRRRDARRHCCNREIAVAGATEPIGYDLRLVSLGDQERDRESQFVRRARRIPWQAVGPLFTP